MPIDRQMVGTLAMEFMERLEQKYGEEASLDGIALIGAVEHAAEPGAGEAKDPEAGLPAAADESQVTIEFDFRNGDGSGMRRHVARGLMMEVDRSLAL